MNENQRKHLSNPFYEEAREMVDEVRVEQILKGAEKYPEPFNPYSWTPMQLVKHALQENVDQQHYIVGLYKQLEALMYEIQRLQEENKELKKFFDLKKTTE